MKKRRNSWRSRMYRVLINRDAQKYIDSLTEKSKRIIKKKLETLKDNPHPGRAEEKVVFIS
nr:hypothetical protein GZ28G7_46 [uncultured archaeon GZfos28G7]